MVYVHTDMSQENVKRWSERRTETTTTTTKNTGYRIGEYQRYNLPSPWLAGFLCTYIFLPCVRAVFVLSHINIDMFHTNIRTEILNVPVLIDE